MSQICRKSFEPRPRFRGGQYIFGMTSFSWLRVSTVSLAAVALLAAALPASISSAAPTVQGPWMLAEDSVNLGVIGADSYAYPMGNGVDRVFATSATYVDPATGFPNPVTAFDCPEAGGCQQVPLQSRFGSSLTMVTLPDGTRRAYFLDQYGGMKTIKTAVVSADGLSHGEAVSTGISVPQTTLAWGVPDAFVGPDGKVHLIWVEENVGAKSSGSTDSPCQPVKSTPGIVTPPREETLVSATATDASGTTFTRDAGYRMTGGYVDPEILRAEAGDWVMIMSTGPGCATQELYTATSTDGIDWTLNPQALTSTRGSALDATGFATGPNTWRIYYTTTDVSVSLGPPDTSYVLRRGTLTYDPAKRVVKGAACKPKNAVFGDLTCTKKGKKGKKKRKYVWK